MRGQNFRHALVMAAATLLSGCATAPLTQSSALSSYDSMKPSDGLITKSRLNVSKQNVVAARTVRIIPTSFPANVAPNLPMRQKTLVANSVDRSLCVSLSDRFRVVTDDEPADLTVRASVTHVTETNQVAAGVSTVASVGMNFVDVSAPIPTPRIPIGMGALSMEAEAIDRSGKQQASMSWARGANAMFSSPRISKAADAYDLADTFGEDFAHLLVKGESPFDSSGVDLPAWHKINSAMGMRPKHAACEQFGRYPGLVGFVGGQLGLPPEWTDKGARTASGTPAPKPRAAATETSGPR